MKKICKLLALILALAMLCCTQVSVEKETISRMRSFRRQRNFQIERTCENRISV